MKRYRAISGALDLCVEVPHCADPVDIFKIAVARAREGTPLGILAEISGEEYGDPSSDQAVYISVDRCLEEMGLAERAK